jgi:hypothetical protein
MTDTYISYPILLDLTNRKHKIFKTNIELQVRTKNQTLRYWLFTADIRVQSNVTSSEIRRERRGSEQRLPPSFCGFSLLVFIPPLLGTNLSP